MDIVILAGGLGSRFFSNSSKISVNFWGIPVLDMLCLNSLKVSKNVYAVLRKDSLASLVDGVSLIFQGEDYGTAAAVQSYLSKKKEKEDFLVIPGDVPLIDSDVMAKFKNHSFLGDLVIGVMPIPNGPEHYGRIIVENGEVVKISEYKDHPEKTPYISSGIFYISKKISHLINDIELNERGEKYLTKLVELCVEHNYKVKTIELSYEDALGFNTVSEFHKVLDIAQDKWRKRALKSHAIFFDINSVYLSYDTEFELGATIEPYCRFLPNVKIGQYGLVKAFSSLENCYINGTVGPFANIRSGEVYKNAQAGAFVEVNRTTLKAGAKAKHLSYLGDADIGENVNIGAGCVICNYDGKKKHKTKIEKNSFIGANTTLISPLNIDKEAFLAAAGAYNKDVGHQEFSIARTKQVNKKRKDL